MSEAIPVQDSIQNRPLVAIKNNEQLDAERMEEDQRRIPFVAISPLTAHLLSGWQEHKAAKGDIETILDDCKRRKTSEYDSTTLAGIQQIGGSENYVPLTRRKCRAGKSWLSETYLQADGNFWSIEPTPDAELSEEKLLAIEKAASQELEQSELQGNFRMNETESWKLGHEFRREIESREQDEAKLSADRMQRLIKDQLVEGSFSDALDSFFDDLSLYPAAFLKGPIFRREEKSQWVKNTSGMLRRFYNKIVGNNEPLWSKEVTEEVIPEFERVSPYNIYPAPGVACIRDGAIYETMRLSYSELYNLIGVDGYDEKEIRAVLKECKTGSLTNWLDMTTVEQSSKIGMNPNSIGDNEATVVNTIIDALEFNGEVPGSILKDWGVPGVDDMEKAYEVNAIVIGSHTIKAVVIDNPALKRPYWSASWENDPDSVWGRGIPQLIKSAQDAMNGSFRSMLNNLAIGAGPQIAVDQDSLVPGQDITKIKPYKIWLLNGGMGDLPIKFFQPQMIAETILGVIGRLDDQADADSGIPKYVQGDTSGAKTGAAGTATGLSMLMAASSKEIKETLKNIDFGVIKPLIECMYYYNMGDSECPDDCKGDLMVKVRGVNEVGAKELRQVQKTEFINLIMQLRQDEEVRSKISIDGVIEVLKQAAKTAEIDVDKLFPEVNDNEVAREEAEQQAQAEAAEEKDFVNTKRELEIKKDLVELEGKELDNANKEHKLIAGEDKDVK